MNRNTSTNVSDPAYLAKLDAAVAKMDRLASEAHDITPEDADAVALAAMMVKRVVAWVAREGALVLRKS
jgi:hypothetical protein